MQQSTDTLDLQAAAVTEDQTPKRNALMHAFSEAEQVVSKLRTVPTDVNVRGSAVSGAYTVHLFFSRNHFGVLEFARTFDAAVTSSPNESSAGVFLDARTRFQGIDVVAWTIVDEAPDPDGPRSDRPVDEDPIAIALTEASDVALATDGVKAP
jgi:hypothetical protein